MKIRRKILRKKKRLTKTAKPAKQKKSAEGSRETKEEKAVAEKLHRISINARRKAYRKNAAVTIIRNGKIIKIYRNGKKKIIGTLRKVRLALNTGKSIKI